MIGFIFKVKKKIKGLQRLQQKKIYEPLTQQIAVEMMKKGFDKIPKKTGITRRSYYAYPEKRGGMITGRWTIRLRIKRLQRQLRKKGRSTQGKITSYTGYLNFLYNYITKIRRSISSARIEEIAKKYFAQQFNKK